jgi:formylglycine-generating enzyme required for sulfatase activity
MREWVERETPQHGVTLEEYAIGRYPVTNAEFKRFVDDGGYGNPDYWTRAGWKAREANGWIQPCFWDDERYNDPAQPVVGVSWYEAMAYCRWLSARTGKPYRLPTEAEWEKAARGDKDSRRYPWGDNWEPKRCNSKESGLGRAAPVGQYPRGDSPYGVGDMAGQVWEWCSSRYGGYADKPAFGYPYRSDDGREDLEGDDTRILRGGAWYNGGGYCRCSCRDGFIPGYGIDYGGFRCARDSLSAL